MLLVFAVAFAACDDDDAGPDGGAATQQPKASPQAQATKASGDVILATTTSTQDSGLLDLLVPAFEEETGYSVKTVAVGSGQAIEQASRGDADIVFAHSPAAEQKMVEEGNGIDRTLIMHNDFIIVGPEADPAGIKSAATASDALGVIASAEATFISRGDNSGTHALELKLWEALGVTPAGGWYQESGQGMGATLQIANQKLAYTISDRGTYLSQRENLDLEVLFEGDPKLLNVYHAILVNPERHSNVNAAGARAFLEFLIRPSTQAIIGEFGVEKFGESLFFPDAGKPEPTG
jgi:tungstate transport system substrate-binding protein